MEKNAQVKDVQHKSDKVNLRNSEETGFGKRKIFVKGAEGNRFHYNPSEAPHYDEEQETLILKSSNKSPAKAKRSLWFRVVQSVGITGSVLWILICAGYFVLQGGVSTDTPYELGIFLAGMAAPIAFFWMILSYLQRNNDVRFYAESLRGEMHSLFFPSEEESRRVNKDIERMSEQAAELAASSRAALKSIQRTRHGLREEIKEFANFARKAESHLISLSDNLVERSGSIALLIENMEERMSQIEKRSHSAVHVWDEASARMVERASDIEAAMEQGANRILSMAEVAEERSKAVSENFDGTITSLGLTVDAVIDRLGGINEEFGAHTRSLQISSEELSKETSRVGLMIEDHINQLQDTAGRSVEAITQSLVAVSDQKDMLEDAASILKGRADMIGDVINGSVTKLIDTSEDIISRAEETEGRLSEKATMIARTLDSVEGQIDRIENVSEMASHRIGEGIETAVNGAQQISDAIRRGVDVLTRTSKETCDEASAIIETTITHIRQLQAAGDNNIKSVETIAEILESSRIQVEKATAAANTHTALLSEAVNKQGDRLEVSALSLADKVKAVARSLEEPLRLVTVAVADADGRHGQISQTLERRVADLREASLKASDVVEGIRQSLREQTNDIASLSGQMISQSKTLNEQLAGNKTILSDTIEMALADINRLSVGLAEKSNLISDHANYMKETALEASQSLTISMNNIQVATGEGIESLSRAKAEFADISDTVEIRITSTQEKIGQANREMALSCEKILPLYDRVDNGSRIALSSLNEFKTAYLDMTEASLSRIDQATIHFEDRIVKLKTGSETVTAGLKEITEGLKDKLNDIEFAAERATDRMHSLTHVMETQSSDIHILTDQATLKLDGIQKLVSEQFHELSHSVGLAVSQIEEVGNQFDTRAQKINETTDIILSRFNAAGDEAQVKAYELKQAVTHIGKTAENAVADVAAQISLLADSSEGSLSCIRMTADTLSLKSKEIDVMMQSVLNQAKTYSDDMRNQVRSIAEQSDISVMQIGKTVSTLMGTMDEVNDKTKSVVNYIQETNQSLYEQSGRFVTAVSKSAQAAEHATEIFSTQADNLLKVSRVAVEKIEDIRKAELRAGRETFLSSARFVLESLHSLSIDFVRVIDGQVAEKDWKSYQKGDIAVFTTKLAERLDQIPSDKIRHKYAEDNEFRNYVQKFMRQFEDVLEQTDSVDRGALLGTTFAASDVGKIYRFLCNVTGRSDKAAA